jgi:hypothetical protein
VRARKLRKCIETGKWAKACVLAIILCHLLQPLCCDLHNLSPVNRTEVHKMLKNLEKAAMVKQCAEHPKLFAYVSEKIDFMKMSIQ